MTHLVLSILLVTFRTDQLLFNAESLAVTYNNQCFQALMYIKVRHNCQQMYLILLVSPIKVKDCIL